MFYDISESGQLPSATENNFSLYFLCVLLTGDIGYRVIFEMIYDKALYDFSNLDMSSVMKT